MRLEVNQNYSLVLKEVYTNVIFETEEGERLTVCMRDGAFEVCSSHKDKKGSHWYSFSTEGLVDLEIPKQAGNPPRAAEKETK